MSRIIVLSIAMLLIGVSPGLSESSSQGIRVVTARDLLNYAEMPAFREALLDRIKHTENGISWGMVVGKKKMGLRGIEWVIFEVKAREKRGLRRDSAFRGMGYLA